MAPSALSKPSNTPQTATTGLKPPRNPKPRHHPSPRPRVRKAPRTPLITPEPFEAAHREVDRQRREYLERGRKGSVGLDRDVLDELDPRAALYLPANNLDARLAYAEITVRHLTEAIDELRPSEPVFFVTLINRTYTVREDEAAAFQVKRLHAWVHQLLRGCDYLGMAFCRFHGHPV